MGGLNPFGKGERFTPTVETTERSIQKKNPQQKQNEAGGGGWLMLSVLTIAQAVR